MKKFFSLPMIAVFLFSIFCCIESSCQVTDIAIIPGDSIVRINVSKIKKVIQSSIDTPPPASGYIELYHNNFDTDIDIDPDTTGQRGNGYIDYVNYITGPGCFHSRPKSGVSGGTRSEVQFKSSRTPVEGAIEYSVKYFYVVKNQCHSFQFHSNVSGSSALLALWHINGKFVVRINNGGNNINQSQPQIPILTGVKYLMRIEYKFGSAGYYRWYINGALYAAYSGVLQNGNGQYLKIGFNGGFTTADIAEALRSDIIIDDLKIFGKLSP